MTSENPPPERPPDLPPAGWYADPEHAAYWRWWDGRGWTDHRSVMEQGPPTAQTDQQRAGSTSPPPATGTAGPAGHATYTAGAPATVATAGGRLAGQGTRLGAFLLDAFFSTVGVLLILFIASLVAELVAAAAGLGTALTNLVGFIGLGGAVFFSILYFYMAEGRTGQTYGKHLLDVTVVSTRDGRPIGSWAAFGRGIVKTIGLYVIGLGVLWILWDPQRQAWHDKAVGSVVVETGAKRHLNPVAFLRHVWES